MTSLPLVWGEGASMESILSGRSEPALIYQYWLEQYDIAAVDSLENLAQDDPDIVILAQPRPMDPADLTDLDGWVRSGGDVIILTDPELFWPSTLPLGDPRRPLASGLLSPLLDHWGLKLIAVAEENEDVVGRRFGDHFFATRGVGRLEQVMTNGTSGVECDESAVEFVIQCSVGTGRASIIADADFLNAALWTDEARRSPKKSGAARFIDTLVNGHFDPDIAAN
ncbi:hypothetical protein [Parasphingorhabdus sp.]|uniref:Gldg family protein n=1 Tax=Parasphingorhabdus sp. TaxID=2709688 RepID=UPI0032670799